DRHVAEVPAEAAETVAERRRGVLADPVHAGVVGAVEPEPHVAEVGARYDLRVERGRLRLRDREPDATDTVGRRGQAVLQPGPRGAVVAALPDPRAGTV